MELNANIQLVMNSFGTLFPDKIFSLTFPWHVSNSLTFPGFPDKWSPWKFHKATPPGSKVLAANMLNCKPIFDLHLKKIVRGTPVPIPWWECASKTWSFSSTCKNFGVQHTLEAEIWSSGKCTLGGYILTFRSPCLLDHSSPDFLPNAGGIAVNLVLVQFWISSSIPEIFTVEVWSRLKWHVFWPKIVFGEGPLKFQAWII